MTLIEIEKRVQSLEQTVQRLTQSKVSTRRRWYRSSAGRFANDPVFEDIVRFGRNYRCKQRPSGSRIYFASSR